MEEMARVGGTREYLHFGGHAMGRGIRAHRYLGKVKVMGQSEVRAIFTRFVLLSQRLVLGAALYADYAWLGHSLTDFRGDPTEILAGAGAGGRLLWNENFLIRFDVALSPLEKYAPGIYIQVGDAF
jgi:hypothetical protein